MPAATFMNAAAVARTCARGLAIAASSAPTAQSPVRPISFSARAPTIHVHDRVGTSRDSLADTRIAAFAKIGSSPACDSGRGGQ